MRTNSIALIACALGCLVHGPGAEASTETVVYSFCSQSNCTDGENPASSVININGVLYGTTVHGGNGSCDFGCGTLFSLDPNTGVETVVHSFPDYSTDGYLPSGNLIDVNGALYGTTSQGGASGYTTIPTGTVFSFNPTNDAETVIYSFCSRRRCKDGSYPNGGVIVGNRFYGTTLYGGKYEKGTAFLLKLETGTKRLLQRFQYDTPYGDTPEGGLIDVDGTLYGVTLEGGTGTCSGELGTGCGTVFSLGPKKPYTETVLHSFLANGTDGAFPDAGLIEADHKLYGTTFAGGIGNCPGDTGCGTLFSVDLKTGTEKTLYFFCSQTNCTDGEFPQSSLINVNGTLYGTTSGGGTYKQGTVFSFDPKTGAETVIYSFCSQPSCTDGQGPVATLISVAGTLYGTTKNGGAYDGGTVFSITP